MNQDLRFPIGEFNSDFEVTSEKRAEFIRTIEELPQKVADEIKDLTEEQIDTEYRPEGWTVRQLVHHIADSHLNAYTRFKLALTEENPTIRPYAEAEWAKLPDSKMPLDISLKILEGVHTRWAEILNSLSDEDFRRKLHHPESGDWVLEKMLGLYDWHSRHHLAHITELKKRKNW